MDKSLVRVHLSSLTLKPFIFDNLQGFNTFFRLSIKSIVTHIFGIVIILCYCNNSQYHYERIYSGIVENMRHLSKIE